MRGSAAAVPRPAGKAAPRPAPATTATRNVREYRKCIECRRDSVQKRRPFTASGSEAARTTATLSSTTIHKQHVPAVTAQVGVNSRMTRRDKAQLRHLPGFKLAALAAPGSNERSVDTSQRACGANSDFFAPLILPRPRALPQAGDHQDSRPDLSARPRNPPPTAGTKRSGV